jgi:hypothetical protein
VKGGDLLDEVNDRAMTRVVSLPSEPNASIEGCAIARTLAHRRLDWPILSLA